MTPTDIPDLLGPLYQDHHTRTALWYLTSPWWDVYPEEERIKEAAKALLCAGECGP